MINAKLITMSAEEKQIELQKYWNEFKAILNVASSRADIMESKYMPLIFAYQEIFNFKGGCIPKLNGINTNSDTSEYEKEIMKYLDKKIKKGKKGNVKVRKNIEEDVVIGIDENNKEKDMMELFA